MSDNMSTRENLGRLSDFEKGRIIGKLEEGKSVYKIATEMERPRTTVQTFVERYRQRQNHNNKPTPGPLSKISARGKRHILREIKIDRRQTYQQLQDKVPSDVCV